MKKRSFRNIIIITLVVVVTTISLGAFHVYSNMLERRIFEELANSSISILDMESQNAFINWTSIVFTLIMVSMIVVIILFIHYRFVRRSLGNFQKTIEAVNKGNLDSRFTVPKTKELGRLGVNFNNMVDTFQRAQKELEEFHKRELRNNYKLATIGEMSARLAHEIRNPATGIANAVEILKKESGNDADRAILEEIHRQANRVNDATTNLLKYSRKADVYTSLGEINEIVGSVVFFLENQARDKQIVFEKDLDVNVPAFRFDVEQIEDVMLNLGMNAIDAIIGSGSVKYATNYVKKEQHLLVSVSDSGSGIPEDVISSVFHPFFTTKNEGTGLGLAIVKETIQKHSGDIWVVNNIDAGCTFTFSLPVLQEEE